MTREDAKKYIYECLDYTEATEVIKALELEPILDKIRAEIAMYEADCRLQGGTDECEKCNSNVFGSIYRIIDKYKAEFEPQESEE